MREFYNRDCMEGMKEYPDKYFDLAIIDPPYGIKEDGRNNHTRSKLAVAKDYRKNLRYDNEPPSFNYFTELRRISKNQIIFGANHFVSRLSDSPCWIVWDKDNGENDFADFEMAYTSFKTAARKIKYRWNGMLQENMKNKETRIHPNQKPVALYRWLLENYAKPGDKILDTHVGSASSLIACEIEGFDYVGFEIDQDYYDAAQKRIKLFRQQPTLFEQHKGQEARPDGADKQETLW